MISRTTNAWSMMATPLKIHFAYIRVHKKRLSIDCLGKENFWLVQFVLVRARRISVTPSLYLSKLWGLRLAQFILVRARRFWLFNICLLLSWPSFRGVICFSSRSLVDVYLFSGVVPFKETSTYGWENLVTVHGRHEICSVWEGLAICERPLLIWLELPFLLSMIIGAWIAKTRSHFLDWWDPMLIVGSLCTVNLKHQIIWAQIFLGRDRSCLVVNLKSMIFAIEPVRCQLEQSLGCTLRSMVSMIVRCRYDKGLIPCSVILESADIVP